MPAAATQVAQKNQQKKLSETGLDTTADYRMRLGANAGSRFPMPSWLSTQFRSASRPRTNSAFSASSGSGARRRDYLAHSSKTV
jgi:hypothetical protein